MSRYAMLPCIVLLATGCLARDFGKCANGAQRQSDTCVLPDEDASSVADGGNSGNDGSQGQINDGGSTDSQVDGRDAHVDDAAGPNQDSGGPDASNATCDTPNECGADAPRCDDRVCSGCRDDDDCTRFMADGRSACGPSGSCVQCATNEDCLDPQAPVCGSQNTCEGPCTSDQDCERESTSWSTPYCELGKGVCVECFPGALEETQCTNGNACDPTALTCSGKPRGSVSGCEACVADSECDVGHRCVAMTFDSQPHGSYCLQIAPPGLCPNGAPSKLKATSVQGLTADYCFPSQSLTTCEAVSSFKDACAQDSECGATGLDDGLCRGPDGAKRCTYLCGGDSDCAGASCVGPVGGKYCDPN